MLSSFLREREEKTETRPSCFKAFFYSERERETSALPAVRFEKEKIRCFMFLSSERERERERERKKSRGELIAKLEVFFLEKESKIDFPIFS